MRQHHENALDPKKEQPQNDRQIAEYAQQSPESFSALYERYVDRIYAFCARRVSSRQAAEDLTSSVFERALSRIDSYRGGSFRAWLFRIAHNAVTDHYRRQRPIISWEPHMSGADHGPTPEDHAVASDDRKHVEHLLSTLTDSQRQVVELRLAGLTGIEIAEVVERSPDAVKMLQYRALERMRSQLSSDPANADTEMPDE